MTVWTGNYAFSRDEPFFAATARVGRRFVDEHARGKPVSADRFWDELGALRVMAAGSSGGDVLLDELEHRWNYPLAPPALYLITCEACARDGFSFLAGKEALGPRTPITKLGQAQRSLVGRLAVYAEQMGMKQVDFSQATLVLRAAFFGRGTAMLQERELKAVARKEGGKLLHQTDINGTSGSSSRIGNESFAGETIVEAICAFAIKRARHDPHAGGPSAARLVRDPN